MNAPLYASGGSANFSVDFSVNYWIDQGFPAHKINLGMGTYVT
jgi:hypothetical protein